MGYAEMLVGTPLGTLAFLMTVPPFLVLALCIRGTFTCPVGCSCASESGVVRCSNGELKEIPQNIPVDTQVLYLDSNRITSIPDRAFKELPKLQELYLANNMIETISPGAFRDITDKLELLDLSHNKIRHVSREVFHKVKAKTRLYSNPWHCECTLQELIETLSLDPEAVNDIVCDTSVQEEYAGKPFIQLLNSGINFCSMQQKTTDVAMLVTMFCWFTMVTAYVVYYVRQNQEDARRHLEYLKSLPSKQKIPGEVDTVSTIL
ncbi:leucine-rich repeat-containing protein 3 [Latimeria chalumnae]|uniref:LRRNT domain-containing protein n=1 Tax=Latimeria chalumnae TaxID=7897 RepID=H3B147_LATCH|nr:PREDICTED: leucine-rich repeat-containing protein 3-like [Latimeria chalumnae]|eukprot:XP_005986185.1 PREDICTED: leucine-rich repeat-containing protein 3-like [Latimeria chalumnae]